MSTHSETTTLHSALDAYAEHVGTDTQGRVAAATGEKRLTVLGRLKNYHDDIPLTKLDLDECIAMIDLWRGRPISERTGRPFAVSTAEDTLLELIRFFGWLDTSDQFSWKAPAYFGQISRRARKLPND